LESWKLLILTVERLELPMKNGRIRRKNEECRTRNEEVPVAKTSSLFPLL
jgi:hypothetical protein